MQILEFLRDEKEIIVKEINNYSKALRVFEQPEISEKVFAWYCGRRDQIDRITECLNGVKEKDIRPSSPPIFDIKAVAKFEDNNSSETLVSHDLFLDGDLSQMAEQKSFLRGRGFELGQQNVYPVVRKNDVVKALSLIWEEKVEGWWHYCDKYVKYAICTTEEFKAAFSTD